MSIYRWERGELGKVAKVYDWREVTRWERCVSGVSVRWQVEKGGRIMRWYGRRSGNVMRCQFGKGETVVSREGGMKFKEEILLHCSKEAKCMQGFDNSYIILRIFGTE